MSALRYKSQWFAASALAGLVAGCATPVIDRPQHATELVPADWSQSEGIDNPVETARYWARLQDPLIDDYVERALQENREIATAQARVAQSRAALRGARAGYRPRVDANVGADRQFGTSASGDVFGSAGANLSWELDLFGRIGFDVAASSAELRAQGASLADVQRLIVGQVARQTIFARGLSRQIEIARSALSVQRENVQIALWRQQAGLVSSRDVEQAKVQAARTSAAIPQLEGQLAATANSVSVLIAQPPGRVLDQLKVGGVIPEPPSGSSLEAPAVVLANRPDVRQAEEILMADLARVGIARSQTRPLVRFGASIGSTGPGIGSLFDIVTGSLVGSLTQLIFDGGRAKADIAGAQARAEASLAIWEQTILTALEDVETASTLMRTTRSQIADLAAAEDAARSAALLAREEYRAGLVDFEALLIAENQLLDAGTALAQAKASHASAFVNLTQALGGGWGGDRLEFAMNTDTKE